jgi:uncharacterized protein YbbK (DUF523 family)
VLPRVGISSCLLGQPVRYDGGHRLDRCIVETLGPLFAWVPVCPEVACGLPTPREPMRLVGDPAAPRLLGVHSGTDHTERALAWARRCVEELAREELCGFVFKRGSPSSGLTAVPVHDPATGARAGVASGLFARALVERLPLLPVEEEAPLRDRARRERFVEAVLALQRAMRRAR